MVNKIVKLWKQQSFTRHIAITFILIFLLQLILVFIITGEHLPKVVENKILDFSNLTLYQASLNVGSVISEYNNSVNKMIIDEDFIKYVNDLESEDITKVNKAKQYIKNEMRNLCTYTPEVRCFTIMTDDYVLFSYDRLEIDSIYQNTPALHKRYLNETIHDVQYWKKGIWFPTEFYDRQGSQDFYLYTYERQIYDWYENDIIGTILISFDENVLSDICRGAQISDYVENNYLFIVDGDGHIISHYNKQILGKKIGDIYNWKIAEEAGESSGMNYPKEVYLDGKKKIVKEESIPGTDWWIISVLDYDYITQSLTDIRKFLIAINMFLGVSVIMAISFVSRKMTMSVKQIVTTMSNVQEGDLSSRINFSKEDRNEITLIGKHFDRMMKTINRQIEEIKEAGRKEKEAEIRALEAQINPHFIYNTLDAINWMAIENGQDEISQMLSRFAQILRYQISDSNSLVTIGEEINYLEKYLFLQKVRFDDSFEYIINCEESVRDCKIYKMIFQPFVENAIVHGYENIDYCGLLRIEIKSHGRDKLVFAITDNGKGIPENIVDEIFIKRKKVGDSIGILNVLSRLDIYYENQYEISVDNKNGTRIEVILPKRY